MNITATSFYTANNGWCVQAIAMNNQATATGTFDDGVSYATCAE